jgi:starch phosphorylase
MKILANGGLNVSELDGWWAEAYEPEVGWALGDGSRTDEEDAAELCDLLEHEVIPEFYDRDASGIPARWVRRIRASVSKLTPHFSSNRMVRQYVDECYAPAVRAHRRRVADGGALAKNLSAWSDALRLRWHQIHFGTPDISAVERGLRFRIAVYMGEVEQDSVSVELFANETSSGGPTRVRMTRDGQLQGATNAHLFEATVVTERPASDFSVRVVPHHPDAFLPAELPLVSWQR